MALELRLLEKADVTEVAGGIHIALAIFGAEIGDQVNKSFSKVAPTWFDHYKATRRQQGAHVYKSISDPRFILAEAFAEDGAIAAHIPGFGKAWKILAEGLRVFANKWSHQNLEPKLDNYILLMESLAAIASLSKLGSAGSFKLAQERAMRISSGEYVTAGQAQTDSNVPAPEVAEIIEKVARREKRPPIGAASTGPQPTRKVRISKAMKDVTENGVSILDSLGADPQSKLADWLRYYPNGQDGEALIDEDGAVMAFKRGQAYLIGWLGEEPKPAVVTIDVLRGFPLPFSYIFTGTDVRELTSNRLLSTSAPESTKSLIAELSKHLASEQMFEATDYGELFVSDEDGTPKVLTTVHKGVWFPGHLPG